MQVLQPNDLGPVAKHVAWRATGADPSGFEKDDLVRERDDLGGLVRDEEDRDRERVPDLQKVFEDPLLEGAFETGERFVQEQARGGEVEDDALTARNSSGGSDLLQGVGKARRGEDENEDFLHPDLSQDISASFGSSRDAARRPGATFFPPVPPS